MWTAELENIATLCFKALENSNYGVRVAVSKLLGTVMATALMPKQATGIISQPHLDWNRYYFPAPSRLEQVLFPSPI